MMIFGTSGNDNLPGTSDPDDFYLGDGGRDPARGFGGDDSFAFGPTFNGHDHVFGGAGTDTILIGAAPGVLHIGGKTINGVEQLLLGDGSDYTLDMHDGAIAGHHALVVNGGSLSIGHSLNLFASLELAGKYVVVGGADNDTIETGGGNDNITSGDGADAINSGYGRDMIDGGPGDDIAYFIGDGAFGAGDRVKGGVDLAGDSIDLSGDYSGGLVITSKMLTEVEHFILDAGNSYTLDFSRANASLHLLNVDGTALGASDVLNFTAADSKHVAFSVDGGDANDAIAASKADQNTLRGNGGADLLTGNKGIDTFWYDAVADSASLGYDTIVGFNAAADHINVAFTPAGGAPDAIDPKVTRGTLSAATFDADLEHAIGAGKLGENDAVLFKARHGDLAGQWFLIVDGNGAAGYQGNEDLVLHLQAPSHLGSLSLLSFGAGG